MWPDTGGERDGAKEEISKIPKINSFK